MTRAASRFRDSAFQSLPAAPEMSTGYPDRRWSAPILCGVSDSVGARAAAETAAGLAALLGTSLVIVHVARPVRFAPLRTRKALDAQRRSRTRCARQVVERVCEQCALTGLGAIDVGVGEPAAGLATMAARHRAWMVVIGASRRPQGHLARDLSHRLVMIGGCPLVVVPPRIGPAEHGTSH